MIETYREYHYIMSEQQKLQETGYAAITYTDHLSDGRELKGTEDFSMERWRSAITSRVIYKFTGERYKSGNRCWEQFGRILARSAKDCGKIARMLAGGAEVSVRKY